MPSPPRPPLSLSTLLHHPPARSPLLRIASAVLIAFQTNDWSFSTQLDFATPVPDAVVDAFNRVLTGDVMYDRKLHDRALAIYDQCLSSGAFDGAVRVVLVGLDDVAGFFPSHEVVSTSPPAPYEPLLTFFDDK